jgi:phage anti-repressor protein
MESPPSVVSGRDFVTATNLSTEYHDFFDTKNNLKFENKLPKIDCYLYFYVSVKNYAIFSARKLTLRSIAYGVGRPRG